MYVTLLVGATRVCAATGEVAVGPWIPYQDRRPVAAAASPWASIPTECLEQKVETTALGVSVTPISGSCPRRKIVPGLVLVDVPESGPAWWAGLRVGDKLESVRGRRVSEGADVDQQLKDPPPVVELRVRSGGRSTLVTAPPLHAELQLQRLRSWPDPDVRLPDHGASHLLDAGVGDTPVLVLGNQGLGSILVVDGRGRTWTSRAERRGGEIADEFPVSARVLTVGPDGVPELALRRRSGAVDVLRAGGAPRAAIPAPGRRPETPIDVCLAARGGAESVPGASGPGCARLEAWVMPRGQTGDALPQFPGEESVRSVRHPFPNSPGSSMETRAQVIGRSGVTLFEPDAGELKVQIERRSFGDEPRDGSIGPILVADAAFLDFTGDGRVDVVAVVNIERTWDCGRQYCTRGEVWLAVFRNLRRLEDAEAP